MVAQVSGKRAKRYLKRQHLLELGEAALSYLTEIVHRRPRSWYETFGWEYVATHLRGQVAPASVVQQGMLL